MNEKKLLIIILVIKVCLCSYNYSPSYTLMWNAKGKISGNNKTILNQLNSENVMINPCLEKFSQIIKPCINYSVGKAKKKIKDVSVRVPTNISITDFPGKNFIELNERESKIQK